MQVYLIWSVAAIKNEQEKIEKLLHITVKDGEFESRSGDGTETFYQMFSEQKERYIYFECKNYSATVYMVWF